MFEISLLLMLVFFSLAFLRERSWLFLPRAISFVFALTAVVFFNVNWIFGMPVAPWMFLLFFGILLFVSFIVHKKSFLTSVSMKKLAIVGAVFATSLLIGISYFGGDFSAPSYKTPDSGTHFLYMNQTLETGVMPLFSPGRIWPASGFTPGWEFHHAQYFPGVTGVYALFSSLMDDVEKATKFQFFSAFGYILLSTYIFSLVFGKKVLPSTKIWMILVALFSVLGTSFNFLVASHVTQIWGLIFLFLFVDSFDAYVAKKENFLVSAVALAGVAMTYFYWIPIAGIFSLFVLWRSYSNLRKISSLLKTFLPLFLGIVFSVGYILVVLKLNMVSHATDDGGVAFQRELLSDAFVAFPFALLQLCLVWFGKRKQKASKIFAADFFGSGAIFAFLLMILFFKGGMISHYTAVKVMYLAVPSAWILSFVFIEDNLDRIKKANSTARIKEFLIRNKLACLVFFVVFFTVVFFSVKSEVRPLILPIFRTNVELIKNGVTPIISSEQLKLLDDVKNNFPEALKEGRIFVVAPADASLWTFAYAGIWPRTFSLASQDEALNKKEVPMSIWSSGIGNYYRWLSQDEDKYIIFLDTKESRNWAESWNFNFDDYEKIHSVGNNHLLKLKTPETQYQYPVSESGKQKTVENPVSFLMVDKKAPIKGIVFEIWTKNLKNFSGKISVSIADGDCEKNNKYFMQKEIAIETDKGGFSDKITLDFDDQMNISGDRQNCLFMSIPGKEDAQVGVFKTKENVTDVRSVYIFKNTITR